MKRWLWAASFFALASAGPSRALSPDLAISQLTLRTWQTDQGLPQNSVRDLAQTPDGYLWIATQAGLARFDGVRFKVWRRSSGADLPHDQISSLAVDRDGSLWIGTLGGLAVYRGGRLESVTPRIEAAPAPDPGRWRIRSLAADDDGRLCVGTNGQGLLRMDSDGGWRHHGEPEGVPSLDFRAIEADGEGGCWGGSLGEGLMHVGPSGRRSVELPTRFVWSLHRSRRGLWIGTDSGVFRLDGDGVVREASFSGDLSRPRVGAILEDKDGNLWVGTQGGGLDRWNGERVESLHSPRGGSGPVIWSLFEDLEGQLWFGSLSGGLSRLEEGLFVSFGVREGLTSRQTHAVIEAPGGGLFVATNSGGVQHIRRDASVRAYTTADGLSSDTSWSLFVDADERLWIGTANRGLDRLDPDGTVAHFGRDDGLPSQRILAVLVDRRGRLWVGTELGATVFRETDGGDWSHIEHLDFVGFGSVALLLEGRGGRIWLAARDGLISYRDGESFQPASPTTGSLPEASIWSLAKGADNRLWIGTFGDGLGLLDGDVAARFGMDRGLPSDDVTAV
ncbi:MAG: two-component regulator propeller domain-containing protein, partial [Acidobacteriota bacterium]